MRRILIISLCFIALSLNAQDKLEQTVGEFSEVKVFDRINLKMKASDQNKVEISGSHKDDVQVVNRNGKLKIRMNISNIYGGEDTVVVLYYKQVDVIDANEGAMVEVKSIIDQYEIDFKTQEGAEITANVKSTYVNCRAVTGGIINITGSTKYQNTTIYTGGELNAKDLISEILDIDINAGGEAYVYATEVVKAGIKAGGNIYLYGNPKSVEESKVIGGTIKRM